MNTYFLKLLGKTKSNIEELEAYFQGRNEATNLLNNKSDKMVFFFNHQDNCYELQSGNNPDDLIDKIINNNMGVTTTKAIRKEEIILPNLKEGSITKRKDSRWQGRYYDNGVRKYLYATTKIEIITKVNKAVIKRNKMENSKVISKSITLNKWIQEWMKLYKPELKAASLEDYKVNIIRKVNDHAIGKKQVSQIKAMDLDKFFLSIKALTSRHRSYILMKGCFKKLKQIQFISENPFDFIDPVKKPKAKAKDIPTATELNAFFVCLKKKNVNLYLFAKFVSVTGLRKGEVLALLWSDITDRISISKSFNTVLGKISTTKSNASIRTIPIFAEAKKILDKLDKTESRVFAKVSLWRSARDFSTIASQYGLNNLSLHSLRHYFATQCLNAGIAEMVTSAWLGHEDSKVTKDIYQHIKTDFETEQVNILAKYRALKK